MFATGGFDRLPAMNKLYFSVALTVAACSVFAETIVETSPDGRNEIRLDTEPALS